MMGRALLFKGEFVAALTAEGRAVPSFMTEVLGDSFDPEEWVYRMQISTPSGDRMVVAPACCRAAPADQLQRDGTLARALPVIRGHE